MISIIIPLYNKQHQIANAIRGILSQSYQDFEIIVVNDGSTDGSVEVLQQFDDPRISLINQANAGVSAARNRGIAAAKGEFVAFLDADDSWESDYLAGQMQLAKDYPTCDVFASNYIFRKNDNSEQHTILNRLPFRGSHGILSNYFEVASCSHPPLWTSAVMVRKSALESVGGFPVGIRSGEDLLTWAKLACRYQIAFSLPPRAIFNVEGYDVADRPKRVPQVPDVVGDELAQLYQEFRPTNMHLYLSHWHKMRSAIYMRLRLRPQSIREALIGLRHNPRNFKLYAFIALNLLPAKIQPF